MQLLVDARTNTFPLEISGNSLGQVYGYSVLSKGTMDEQASVQALHKLFLSLGEEECERIGSEIIIDYPSNKRHPITFFYTREELPQLVLDTQCHIEFMQRREKCSGSIMVRFALDLERNTNQFEFCRFINLVLRDAVDKMGYFNINRRYFDISTLENVRTQFKGRSFDIGWIEGMKIGAVVFGQKLNLQILPVNTRFERKTISQYIRENPQHRRFVKSMTVMTLHNGMQYKITDVDENMEINSLMNPQKPEAGTFLQNFAKQEEKINEIYNNVLGISGIINELEEDNYMLKAVAADKIKKGRIRKTCYLPPHLCIIMNDPMNSPAFGLTREVRERQEIDPVLMYERAARLLGVVKRDSMLQEVFNEYEIQVEEEEPEKVYKLPTVEIVYNNNEEKTATDQRQRIDREFPCQSLIYRSQGGVLTGGLRNWGVIAPSSRVGGRLAASLEQRFKGMCRVESDYNKVENALVEEFSMDSGDLSVEGVVDAIYGAMGRIYRGLNCESANEVEVFVVVLPAGNKEECSELYKCFKSRAFADEFVTECILESNVERPQIIDSLAEQIYAKAGGSVWAPDVPVYFEDTMCCALDVSRPRVESYSRGPMRVSAGFVSTYYGLEHFYSQSRPVHRESQAGEVQASREVADYLDSALKRYYYFRDRCELPKKIVFYRDGVADGQIRDVLSNECAGILRTLQQRAIQDHPQFEFYMIIAQKAPPMRICGIQTVTGTFVCDTLNSFYLASATVPQGTTPRPVRYFILRHCIVTTDSVTDVEETQESLEELINYTNSLAYGYVNWNGAIATPHILHMAHHLSRYTNEVLQGQESISDAGLMGINMRPYYI